VLTGLGSLIESLLWVMGGVFGSLRWAVLTNQGLLTTWSLSECDRSHNPPLPLLMAPCSHRHPPKQQRHQERERSIAVGPQVGGSLKSDQPD
jgi:hypothetical protein